MENSTYQQLLKIGEKTLGTSKKDQSPSSQDRLIIYNGVSWEATVSQVVSYPETDERWVSGRFLFLGRTVNLQNLCVQYGLQEAIPSAGGPFYSEYFHAYASQRGVGVSGMLTGLGVSDDFDRSKTVLGVFPEICDLSYEMMESQMGEQFVPVGVVRFYDEFSPEKLEDVTRRLVDRYASRENTPLEFSSQFW